MTKQAITDSDSPAQALRAYFARCRANAVDRYLSGSRFENAALRRAIRANARSQALHYSRLVRKMEGAK